MTTLTRLGSVTVRTVSGRVLGHLFDLRCVQRGSQAKVTHLVYGRRGLLERLGFRQQRGDVPIDRVVEIGEREIVVSD